MSAVGITDDNGGDDEENNCDDDHGGASGEMARGCSRRKVALREIVPIESLTGTDSG